MRKYTQLTIEQRYQIQSYLRAKMSKNFICSELNIHRSTLYRELKRNSTNKGKYNANRAQEISNIRKERLNKPRLFTDETRKIVDKYLIEEQWSPDEIKGYCDKHNIPMVSHERIYQYIRLNKKKGGDLYKHLRHRLKHRKRPVGMDKIKIPNRVSIEQRPENVNKREVFGHWEADLIVGKNHKGVLLTLTERVSKHLIIKFVPEGKNATGVANAIIKSLIPYKDFVHSITMDNGLEFAEHQKVAKKLNAKTYFTAPYCSWQKGQIEYMNKLIRQYIPKNQEIKKNKTLNINMIQRKINNRPRKNLNYKKPFQIFYNFVNDKGCTW